MKRVTCSDLAFELVRAPPSRFCFCNYRVFVACSRAQWPTRFCVAVGVPVAIARSLFRYCVDSLGSGATVNGSTALRPSRAVLDLLHLERF